MTKKKRVKEAEAAKKPIARGGKRRLEFSTGLEEKKLIRALGLVVAAIGALFYLQTIHYSFTFDDYSIIKENNQTMQGIGAIPEIFKSSYRFGYTIQDDDLYRPLPKAIYAALWSMSPDNPLPLHVLNILLYALTGYLLFLLLAKLMPANLYVPFIAAALWMAHPIHTEVVANIKSMDEILSFLFFIVSLTFLMKYISEQKAKWIVLSCLSYFLSLLSKESAITFIVIFPLVIYFFTDAPLSKNIRASLLLLIPAALFLLIRHSIINSTTAGSVSIADNFLVAAPDTASQKATAVMILGLYLKLLLLPTPLRYDYSYNEIPIVTMSDWRFIASFLIYAAITVYALYTFRRKDDLSFAILFFLVTISISSNLFIVIGTPVAERLMYAPSFGFCLAAAILLDRLFKKGSALPSFQLRNFLNARKGLIGVVTIILVLFGIKTFSQNPVWTDNMSLFESGVISAPNSTKTHFYLGGALMKPEYFSSKPAPEQAKIISRGMAELKRSIGIDSAFADAWEQLGLGYYYQKNYDSAMYAYNRALVFAPDNATFHNNVGNVYFDTGKYDQALQAFSKAIASDPTYADAYSNMGSTYGMMKDYDKAIQNFVQAIHYNPNNASAYYFLGITYQNKGDQQSAAPYLRKAAELDPKYKQ